MSESSRITEPDLQAKIHRFARANPPYGTDPDRWLADRKAEFEAIQASMRACVIAKFGGGQSTTLMDALTADMPRAIGVYSTSSARADRLVAAKELVLNLKLLKQQWQAVSPMPAFDGEYRAALPRPGTVVRLCEDPLPLPNNGEVFTRQGEGHAPLEIRTRPGEGNCFLKFVRPLDGSTMLSFFVRDGETAEVAVPSGRYELRYARGTDWFGRRYLFGPSTMFAKVAEPLAFNGQLRGGRGYAVELFQRPSGNVQTTPIPPAAF